MFEVKFPLGAERVAPVIEWLRSTLEPDPHGTGEHGDEYVVQSLYLDTPRYDVFHRRGSYARAKFRIRRYGEGDVLFLERKLKRGGIVRKRRVAVPAEDVAQLNLAANGAVWPGAWFHHRLAVRSLRPVVRMSYRRVARLGGKGAYRVTLDRELRAQPASAFDTPCVASGADLLEGRGVLEVKFDTAMPAVIKGLIERLGLAAGPLSKYRTGVTACGLVAADAAAGRLS